MNQPTNQLPPAIPAVAEKKIHTVQCANCHSPVDISHHMPRTYNMPQTIMVVIEHSGPVVCPGCLTQVTPCCDSIDGINLVAMPVSASERSMIVAPGMSM